MDKVLILGAGNRVKRIIRMKGKPEEFDGQDVTTIDFDRDSNPDILWDLTVLPLPLEDNTFDEIHAYDVMEHLHQQGDFRAFFALWSELWRIAKPGALMHAASPHWSSPWAWMDPGHTCAYGPEIMAFLDQSEYEGQVGNTPMTDYRNVYKADWHRIYGVITDNKQYCYVLEAIKPSRIPKERTDERDNTGTSHAGGGRAIDADAGDFGDAGC